MDGATLWSRLALAEHDRFGEESSSGWSAMTAQVVVVCRTPRLLPGRGANHGLRLVESSPNLGIQFDSRPALVEASQHAA